METAIKQSSPTRKGRRTRGGRGKGPGRGRGRGGGAAGRGAGRGQHNTNNKNTNDVAVIHNNKEQPQDNTDTTPSQMKSVLGTDKDKTSTTTKSGVAFQVNTAPVDIELDNHHTKKKFGSSPILSNKERRNQQKKERDRIKNESLQKQKENMCNQDSSAATGKHPSSKKVSSDASSQKDMTRPASKQNKSTPQPSSKDGSTLKNIDEHSTSNTIKGANNNKKKSVTISGKDSTRESSSEDAPQPSKNESEKERTARLLREAREKSALAKEKKKSKKSKKHDKWIKQQEAEKSARAKSWQDKIAKEDDSINLISQLITSEVVRKNKDKGLAEDQVNDNLYASQVIADESKNANDALFGGIKCRVKVAGSERQDLNGRTGTLRYWDANEKKFFVGLDTKKAKDCEEHFLSPENVEPIGSVPRTEKNKLNMQSYHVDMTNDFLSHEGDLSGIGCQFTIDKATIASIRSAESIPVGLAAFSLEQNKKEKALRKKEAKERREALEEEKQAEEDRKRRAEKRKARKEAQEKRFQASQARRQAENSTIRRQRDEEHRRFQEKQQRKIDKLMEKEKREQYEEMKREWEEKMKEEKAEYIKETIEGMIEEDPKLREKVNEFLDEYGEEWEEPSDFYRKFDKFLKHGDDEKKKKLNAEILGVDPDADERTITVAYRKLALMYHPDKWRADSSHGLSKEDAEAKFKVIQNAADDLLSKFDEEDEEASYSSEHSSQADSYENDFEQYEDEEKKDEEDDFEEFDEFHYERNAGKEDKYDRHFNNLFPDMPSFDEFQSVLGSRGTGGRVKVTEGFVRWMAAKNAYERRDADDDDEDMEGGLGCVVS